MKHPISVPTFKQRSKAMLLCYLVFIFFYMLAQYYSVYIGSDYSFTMRIDNYIPFWQWMIIPYSTSGLFFLCSFYWVNNTYELRLFTKRMLVLSLIAFLCFLAFPIKYSIDKPVHTFTLFNPLFDFIQAWDTPYNQAPSLHVGYSVLIMNVVASTKVFSRAIKILLQGWLILICVSTLFVFQHHSIDVFTALVICLGIFYFLPNKQNPYLAKEKKHILYGLLATLVVLIFNILL
ncbi:phosphatase PAP2 family protein [Myroides sp. LJL116]